MTKIMMKFEDEDRMMEKEKEEKGV